MAALALPVGGGALAAAAMAEGGGARAAPAMPENPGAVGAPTMAKGGGARASPAMHEEARVRPQAQEQGQARNRPQVQEQGPHPGGFAGGEPRINRSIGNFASTTFLAPSMIIICCFSKLDARGSGSRLPARGGSAHPGGVLHARATAAACLPAWAAAGQPAC